jgi:hypothetical protein
VDWRGKVIMEYFVAPTMEITNYRGLTKEQLDPSMLFFNNIARFWCTESADSGRTTPFPTVQQRVAQAIRGKLLIGHALWNDLSGNFTLSHMEQAGCLTGILPQYLAFLTLLVTCGTWLYTSHSAMHSNLTSSSSAFRLCCGRYGLSLFP